eukprot:CAMPEP_0176005206 /NCGR_PEP_ID=MMETSP0120_2-20121206/2087_1 /TAXON_ID=160619 /ORGANISM="Kryptoperidinium foliaceum, Strain CCMP 1326" /LENGTH=1259 /DNA_ID=CAMNT_0017337907 /DNA_START=89 /DNA_END=3864 /DNA_ORIENTATION=+
MVNVGYDSECMAFVASDDKDLFVLDAGGNWRSFRCENGKIQQLCFSSHGQNVDDFLSPCFDEAGNHGDPEESCFCGLDSPHIHAHVYDPETCRGGAEPSAENSKESGLMNLSKITLLPVEGVSGDQSLASHSKLDCNADVVQEILAAAQRVGSVKHGSHEDALVQDGTSGNVFLAYDCSGCQGMDCHGVFALEDTRQWSMGDIGGGDIRMKFYRMATLRGETKITLEDLKDPLVQRSGPPALRTTSKFGTMKPTEGAGADAPTRKSNSCGAEKKVASCCASKNSCSSSQSKQKAERMSTSCCSKGSCSKNQNTPATSSGCGSEKKKTSCCASNTTSCASEKRCCAKNETLEDQKEATARSSGCCSKGGSSKDQGASAAGGCCVSKTGKNSPCCSSEASCCTSKLGCCTKKDKQENTVGKSPCCATGSVGCCGKGDLKNCDGDITLSSEDDPSSKSTKRSTFYVKEICCATEVASIRSILSRMDGIDSMSVNVTSKILYVNHDLEKIHASTIRDELNRERFGAHIEQDGALKKESVSSFVTSVFGVEGESESLLDKDALDDFLSSYENSLVQNFVVDVPGRRIVIVHNPFLMPLNSIMEELSAKLQLQTSVVRDGSEEIVWDFSSEAAEAKRDGSSPDNTEHGLRPTVILSGMLWIVSMLSFIGGDWQYLQYVALLSVAFGLPPIALKAAVTLRRCRFDVNCLMTFAVIGALALQEYTEAAAVTFLFALSEWLEARATSRARSALSAIVQLRPETANLIHPQTGEVIVVPAAKVPVGCLVSVKAGDQIPCDGIVSEGSTTVDESSLTGESRPVRKNTNDVVSGGTINSGNTQITVRTTALAEDSAVARLIRLVEEAQANRSQTEQVVDKFAQVYTPFTLLVAISMCTFPWIWGKETGREWVELGLVVIVVACPCALIISTPVTYVAGLAATAQKGVLIKGGAHLEALGALKTICFDKTGTLTRGKFSLLHLDVMGGSSSRHRALQYLALMEQRASHPLGQALVEGARNEGVEVPKNLFVRNHTFLPGEGIVGNINGTSVHVGNKRLFERLGLFALLSDSDKAKVAKWETIGTVGFMTIGGQDIDCIYCVADAVRPESREVLLNLGERGINTMMLTGDNSDTARSIGFALGMQADQIKSQILPEEKLSIVASLKDESSPNGHSIFSNPLTTKWLVAMVGDGVNDAPALAAADIGVAVAGSALAMETADVTLMDSKLWKLVYSIDMGQRVIRKIKENVAFSLIVKFLVLGFALAGKAALWAA